MTKQGAWVLTAIFGLPTVGMGALAPLLIPLNPAMLPILLFGIVVGTIAVMMAWNDYYA